VSHNAGSEERALPQNNTCPSAQPGAKAPSNAHDSSNGITSINTSKSPPGSVTVTAPNGNQFQAPGYANFQNAYQSGAQDGWNPFALDSDFGHWGTYDYQRVGSTVISEYTYASNYAVGVGLNGAGIPRWAMVPLIDPFIHVNPSAAVAMTQGWNAAASGACAKPGS